MPSKDKICHNLMLHISYTLSPSDGHDQLVEHKTRRSVPHQTFDTAAPCFVASVSHFHLDVFDVRMSG